MLGTNLYGYTIKSSLGSGGMAEVWYAESKLGEPVAIKIMLSKFKDEPQVTTRFEIEAKAMSQLNHENIRKVINYGEHNGRPFIIMEYLEGTDLSTLIENGYKPMASDLEKWWQQCLSALEHTHSKGIIHRDIKPSNIFLLNSGEVKLLDFGIAKVKDEISLTRTGQGLGTVMYMSPEQILNPKNVTSVTDIYSLGVSFAHLIKGTPFVQNTESTFKVQTQITQGNLDLSGIDGFWLNRIKEATKLEPTERKIATSFSNINKTKILTPDYRGNLNSSNKNKNKIGNILKLSLKKINFIKYYGKIQAILKFFSFFIFTIPLFYLYYDFHYITDSFSIITFSEHTYYLVFYYFVSFLLSLFSFIREIRNKKPSILLEILNFSFISIIICIIGYLIFKYFDYYDNGERLAPFLPLLPSFFIITYFSLTSKWRYKNSTN